METKLEEQKSQLEQLKQENADLRAAQEKHVEHERRNNQALLGKMGQ